MLSNEVAIILPGTGAVWRPDILAFGENRLDNVRILVILPGFLWFSAHSERYWAVCQAAKSRSECAVNYKKTTKSQVLSFARTYARILPGFFVKIRLDFARIFTKMSPVEELATLHCWYPWPINVSFQRRLRQWACDLTATVYVHCFFFLRCNGSNKMLLMIVINYLTSIARWKRGSRHTGGCSWSSSTTWHWPALSGSKDCSNEHMIFSLTVMYTASCSRDLNAQTR